MYKIKQKETDTPTKYLELREDINGNIDLVCHLIDEEGNDDDWTILTIKQDGKIQKSSDIPEDCGFKLDAKGAVIITEES